MKDYGDYFEWILSIGVKQASIYRVIFLYFLLYLYHFFGRRDVVRGDYVVQLDRYRIDR